MAKALLKRSEMPADMLWDVQSVYPSDAAWDEAYKTAAAAIPGVARYQGRLGESGAVLLEALRARDTLTNTLARILLYPGMQMAGDNADQAATARNEQAGGLWARAAGAMAFFEPERFWLWTRRAAPRCWPKRPTWPCTSTTSPRSTSAGRMCARPKWKMCWPRRQM